MRGQEKRKSPLAPLFQRGEQEGKSPLAPLFQRGEQENEENAMQVMEVLGRVVMLPINALTTGTEMVAQSTKSVQKMAEKGVESVLGLESSDDGHEADEG